jgi:fluoride exporter
VSPPWRVSPAQLTAAAILAGGAAGALTRAAVGRAFEAGPGAWPWATFAVNVAGALILGWLTTIAAPWRYWRPLLGTGFCGALTTFSTFQVETITIAREGHGLLAAGYAAGSITAGMAAVAGATLVTRRHRRG